MIDKETIRAARSANLVKWLLDNGYSLKKEPGDNYRLPGNGGLIIKENRWKQFSTGDQGNAIDFLTHFLGMNFKEAVEQLSGTGTADIPLVPRNQLKPQKEFKVPEAAPNCRRVIAYLTQKRKLPAELVISLIKKKLIWQDIRGNCVFPCCDESGRIVGAMLRGTLSEVRWVGTSPGSDVSPGWIMPGKDESSLAVTESPIEAMSLYTLKPELRGWTFLALGGLHWESVIRLVEKGGIRRVILGLNPDRDSRESWGQLATAEIAAWLKGKGIVSQVWLPVAEDWNADLVMKN